ncbi:hypothetical protein [Sinanaerobacter sp. ZZT-01]|uniref:hypothetical protein n=1 Tax=Sinanaerobacter sp. ZZT-01 TaxID=3111540 RepID=UPI002D793DA8|nr:hypothetical protein [Sinanaerobacter sp. ZZT-01]WRR92169.1 hypothetical protein U5921_08795 [Sinanaerobacter sp. ZZT-01]
MSDFERIIENVNATMSMEDMPLKPIDKERIRDCLDGSISFHDAIEILVAKYFRKQAV